MKNKVLIKIYIPELDFATDVFVPVNEIIWKVKLLIIQAIFDMTGGALDKDKNYLMINKETSFVYQNNSVLIDTDIRNATEIILILAK